MKALLIFLLFFSFSIYGQEIPELNQQIVELIRAKMGKKVDRGECWDIAAYALNTYSCKWDGKYEFGKKIDPNKQEVFPGDIIQFEKVVLLFEEGNMKYKINLAHHTAIVNKVYGKGDYEILEQNTSDFGKKVSTSKLKLNQIQKGKVIFYRPILE